MSKFLDAKQLLGPLQRRLQKQILNLSPAKLKYVVLNGQILHHDTFLILRPSSLLSTGAFVRMQLTCLAAGQVSPVSNRQAQSKPMLGKRDFVQRLKQTGMVLATFGNWDSGKMNKHNLLSSSCPFSKTALVLRLQRQSLTAVVKM